MLIKPNNRFSSDFLVAGQWDSLHFKISQQFAATPLRLDDIVLQKQTNLLFGLCRSTLDVG